jgi:alpha-tubulin suppressor-like RCC1 family protein
VALFCDGNTPCEDPALPFCDLNGEFEASEGITNTCIPDPFGGADSGVDPDAIDASPGPDAVVDPAVIQAALGLQHTCALLNTGAVRCWGEGGSGQLGYGNTANMGDDEHPFLAGDVPLGGPATQISAGGAHTCALMVGGGVRCWGLGASGQLGYPGLGNVGDTETPESVGDVSLGLPAAQIVTGDAYTCARLENGAVRCWGFGQAGRLGYGNEDNIGDDENPTENVSVGESARHLTAGTDHTCAILTNDEIRCWGRNSTGALGYGHDDTIGDNELPSSQPSIVVGMPVDTMQAGSSRTCALSPTGGVRCWGAGLVGLGYGNTATIGDNEDPASAGDVPVGAPVSSLVVGTNQVCVILTTGGLRCWGGGGFGKLGYGTTQNIGDDETPAAFATNVPIGGVPADLPVTASGDHSCVILDTGGVRCWGRNASGQLGYGSTENIGDNEPILQQDVQVLDP